MPKGVEEQFHVVHENKDWTHPVKALENVLPGNRRPGKAGTMTIDRFWRFVKSRLPKGGISARTVRGRRALWLRIRAAQWLWMTGPHADRWALFCDVVKRYRAADADIVADLTDDLAGDHNVDELAADHNRTGDAESSVLEHQEEELLETEPLEGKASGLDDPETAFKSLMVQTTPRAQPEAYGDASAKESDSSDIALSSLHSSEAELVGEEAWKDEEEDEEEEE